MQMFSRLVLGAGMLLLILSISGRAFADDTQGQFSLGLNLGGAVYAEDDIDESLTAGFQLAYGLLPTIELRGSYFYMNPDVKAPPDGEIGDIEGNSLLFEAVYKFMPESRFVPYLGAGIGYSNIDFSGDDDEYKGRVRDRLRRQGLSDIDSDFIFVNREADDTVIFDVLGGFEYFFIDRISLQFEGKYTWSDAGISGGFTYLDIDHVGISDASLDNFQFIGRAVIYF